MIDGEAPNPTHPLDRKFLPSLSDIDINTKSVIEALNSRYYTALPYVRGSRLKL
jgi:hypothetical protein